MSTPEVNWNVLGPQLFTALQVAAGDLRAITTFLPGAGVDPGWCELAASSAEEHLRRLTPPGYEGAQT